MTHAEGSVMTNSEKTLESAIASCRYGAAKYDWRIKLILHAYELAKAKADLWDKHASSDERADSDAQRT
jgi:hypothetical protein